jgi:hypothetical protein
LVQISQFWNAWTKKNLATLVGTAWLIRAAKADQIKRAQKLSFYFATFEPGSGLPDGLFSDQKPQLGYISVDLGMENVDMCSGPLEYLRPLHWVYNLWTFLYFLNVVFFKKIFFPPKNGPKCQKYEMIKTLVVSTCGEDDKCLLFHPLTCFGKNDNGSNIKTLYK